MREFLHSEQFAWWISAYIFAVSCGISAAAIIIAAFSNYNDGG